MCGCRYETLHTTHVRKNYGSLCSHIDDKWFEKVEIGDVGRCNRKIIFNSPDSAIQRLELWSRPQYAQKAIEVSGSPNHDQIEIKILELDKNVGMPIFWRDQTTN